MDSTIDWQSTWAAEQAQWSTELSFEDDPELDKHLRKLEPEKIRIAGVDLSFVSDDKSSACAAYVVLNVDYPEEEPRSELKAKKRKFLTYPDYEVLYQDFRMVKLVGPYVPGFLAFRESDPIIQMVRKQMDSRPDVTPHVLMVDGNGLLHPRKFGLACHVGLKLNIPTIGVAKNLYFLQNHEMSNDSVAENRIKHKEECRDRLKNRGDLLEIPDFGAEAGDGPLGIALKTACDAANPVYVSVGHQISLNTARQIVLCCSRHRIPEPTRQADMRSREFLRNLESTCDTKTGTTEL